MLVFVYIGTSDCIQIYPNETSANSTHKCVSLFKTIMPGACDATLHHQLYKVTLAASSVYQVQREPKATLRVTLDAVVEKREEIEINSQVQRVNRPES